MVDVNVEENHEVVTFPFVKFKLKGDNYCISSKYVLQIILSTQFTPIPQTADYVKGLLHIRDTNFPIIDLRTLYDIPSVEKELMDLELMKQKHLEWVDALEKSVEENKPFTLAKDEHSCAFGIWYDSLPNKLNNPTFTKINQPHKELHHQAVLIDNFKAKNDDIKIKNALSTAKNLCVNQIIPLLDDIITEYKNINKGMIILLSNDVNHIGLLIDDIKGIDYFNNAKIDNPAIINSKTANINNTIVSEHGNIYFEISAENLLNLSPSIMNNAN